VVEHLRKAAATRSQAGASRFDLRRVRSIDAFDISPARSHLLSMSKLIQIRNVPNALHRRLKSRAALVGKPLSDFLLAEIREAAERLTPAELRARLATREPFSPSPEPALAVRAERDGP
jgi:antitoxin FitA